MRFFERNNGDYYSIHGENAIYVANEHYLTQSVLKQITCGDKSLISCTLSKNAMETFLEHVLMRKKVQVWALSEPRKSNSWVIVREASPGNFSNIEDMIVNGNDPAIIAVQICQKGSIIQVNIGFANAGDCKLGFLELLDNELLTNLENLLVQLNVKECVFCESVFEKRLKSILLNLDCLATKQNKKFFVPMEVESLNRLLINEIAILPDAQGPLSALSALIYYLGLQLESNTKFQLVEHFSSHFMKLDAHALCALGLIGEGSRKNTHLLGLLNHCLQTSGTKLLESWIRQPLIDVNHIQSRLDVVSEFFEDHNLRDSVRRVLSSMPDIPRISRKIRSTRANLQDVVVLYQAVQLIPMLITSIQDTIVLNSRYQEKLTTAYRHFEPFIQMVEETIDLEAAQNREYIIKAEYDEVLVDLKQQIDLEKLEIDLEVDSVAKELGIELHKVLKVENNSTGYFLRLSPGNQHLIKGKGYLELGTYKSGVQFRTKKLTNLSQKLLSLQQEYNAQQNGLVKKLMLSVETYVDVFCVVSMALSEIDVFQSLAQASCKSPIPYQRPIIEQNANLLIKKLRHPCVEMQDVCFIPNDVEMIRGESEFLILTGPNMGGKSTYIRQIGICCLLAQMGCFVPCDYAKLPVFSALMCRIGASDDQMKGISTFMSEMLETSAILRTADSNSLVIIDELGRGTSTSDGYGLAYSISKHLAEETRCFSLFATHFHELTCLESEIKQVKNMHVQAIIEKNVTLMYKVEPGICDQSFGINVAKMAGLPKIVIQMAQLKAELQDYVDLEEAREIVDLFLNDFKQIPLDLNYKDQIKELSSRHETRIKNNHFLSNLFH